MSGHLSAAASVGYVAGRLSGAASAAVEHHLAACPTCRSLVAAEQAASDPARIELDWYGVLAELDAPRRGMIERALVRIGVPADTVRLMAATPALRRAWFVAVGVALLFGLAASNPDRPEGTVLWFLALAPLVPVIGVALAFGPDVDPAYEITVATPMSGFRLLLVRASAVIGTAVALGGLVSLLMWRRQGALVAAWLLPSLALSMVCLGWMTRLPSRVAAAVVTFGWLTLVVAFATRASDELALFRPAAQVVYLAVFAVGALNLVLRRAAFDVDEGDRLGAGGAEA